MQTPNRSDRVLPTKSSDAQSGLFGPVQFLAQSFIYRFSWPRLLSSNLILAAALGGSVYTNIVLWKKLDAQPRDYFATTADGRIMPIIPLSAPIVSPSKVIQFAQDCVTRTFTLTFVDRDLKGHLQSLHGPGGCYTSAGYASLMQNKGFDELIKKIRGRQLIASAVATGAGVITETSKPGAPVARWVIQQPISLTLAGQAEQKSYSFIMESSIERVPLVDNPEAIATSSIRWLGDGQ